MFTGEDLTIDCARGEKEDPILHYRKSVDGEQLTYFMGDKPRVEEAKRLEPRSEGKDFWYDIEAASAIDGGEYECDWTGANDETNHYVTVVDKGSITCPEAPARVIAGDAVEGLQCSISKSGALLNDWLNDKTKETGLIFTAEDDDGMQMDVFYEETVDKITAKIVNLNFHKRQNGTALTCKFVSMHKTEISCETSPIQVDCDDTSDPHFCSEQLSKTDSANAIESSFVIFGLCALVIRFNFLD